jgi:predicted RNase H-like HicB family nuclease
LYSVPSLCFSVKIKQEENGCWLAKGVELPGVLAYCQSPPDV